MRVLVIVHPVPKDIRKILNLKVDDYIIGVDQAILDLYKQRIKIDLAVGDFDSLKNQHMLLQLDTLRLKPEKDVTDSYQALVEATKKQPDEIIMIGGFGGNRIEHFMAHLTLFNEFNALVMIDDYSRMYMLKKGVYKIDSDGFISLFAYPDAEISLPGFKYELDHYKLSLFDPLCISNEVVRNDAEIVVHEGRVIIVISKKD